MKKITQEELKKTVEKHLLWLQGSPKGKKADLSYTDLTNANLKKANLTYANLTNANLENADLSYANLENAKLESANLRKADLSYTELTNTNLYRANLRKADLTNTSLANCNLAGVITDKKYVQIPDIGSRQDTTTFCVEDKHIWCGCWNDYKGGSLEEFIERVEEIYGEKGKNPDKKYYDEYKNAIKYFTLLF